MRILIMIAMMIPVLFLSGCQSSLKGDTYSRDEVRQEHQVYFAIVESVRFVVIEGTKSPVGTIVGTLIGGIAGSALGMGKGSEIGTVMGATAGGIAGSVVEEEVTKRQGIEITVRYDDGHVVAIVQEASENELFSVGDRIRVITQGSTKRISH